MSEIRYGFVNDIPIDPGYGKEIVPLNESIAFGVEVYDGQWVESGQSKPWRLWTGNPGKVSDLVTDMAYKSYVLAFRRPKQTAQAESAPDLSGMIALGQEQQGIGFSGASTHPSSSWSMETMEMINKLTPNIQGKAFDPGWFLLRQRLEAVDHIRTLTAAQAVALDDANRIIVQMREQWRMCRNPKDFADVETQETHLWKESDRIITLIQQAKEVGK